MEEKALYLPEAQTDTIWAFLGSPWGLLAGWLILIKIVTFLVFGLDKLLSKHPRFRQRVPEKNLLLLAVVGGSAPLVSVRTRTDIPKGKIFDCMEAIRAAKIEAPVHIGDVVVENVCGTGVDVVATKAVAEKPAAGAAECLRNRAALLPSAGAGA